ncbi:tandem-95 repeat protein, partial [Rhizobium sp. L1K21]|uniref:tandem-95 repeat protein n=1 Tax=Rhizobium sp. L1K21 TaxID=2954933 RepID=UPI0020923893
ANFNGADTFDVLVDDGHGGTDTVTIAVTVDAVNDAPIGTDGAASGDEDTLITGTVVASDVDGDSLTYTVSSAPAHGTVTLSGNGYTYTPNANFNGADTFDVLVDDGHGGTDTVTIAVTVDAVNDAPIGTDGSASGDEDTLITGTVVASDVDGDSLTYTVSSAPAHGTVTLSGNGYTYTPDANFNGSDTFDVLVDDGHGGTDTVTIAVTVDAVNDAPVGTDGSASGDEDTVITGTVVASDVDGDSLTYTVSSNPAHGTVTLSGNGYTYTPDANFNGADTFDVLVDDGHGGTDTLTIAVTVDAVNDAPVAQAISVETVTEDDALQTINLLAGQSDVDAGDVLSVANITVTDDLGVSVAFTNNGDGTISIDPAQYDALNDGESRRLTVAYDVTDGTASVANTATLIVTGATDNTAPVSTTDTYLTLEDRTLVIPAGSGVLANDSDIDGDALSSILVSNVSHGTLVLNTDGSFTYTPAANFSGIDSFTYRANDGTANGNPVTVTIDVAPVADGGTLNVVGSFEAVAPLINVSDYAADDNLGDLNPAVSQLSNGDFVVTWSGKFGSGFDIFARIFDASGQPVSGEIRVSNTTSANFADDSLPSVTALADGGFVISWYAARDGDSDVYARIYDADGRAVSGEINISDTAGDNNVDDSASSLTALSSGGFVVTWVRSGGSQDLRAKLFDATGNAVSGEIDIGSTAYDANASVTPLSDGGFVVAWRGIQNNDNDNDIFIRTFDASGNAISGEINVSEYISDTNRNDFDPAITALSNGGLVVTWHSTDGSREVYARILDASGNAVSDEINVSDSVYADSASSVAALPNGGFIVTWWGYHDGDYDIFARAFDQSGAPVSEEINVSDYLADNNQLDLEPSVTALSNGGFVVTWHGTHDGDYDVFARIFSGAGGTEDTDYPIEIGVTLKDSSETVTGLVLSGFPAGATFALGHADGATWVIDDAGDVASILTSGAITMTPPANYSGTFSLTTVITVSDTALLSSGSVTDTTTVTETSRITINAVNDAPVGTDGSASGDEDTAITGTVVASDVDGDSLTYSVSSNPSHGTVTLSGSGYTYTPDADFNGSDTFDVLIDDGNGGTDTVTIAVTVNAVNDAPVVQAIDLGTVSEDDAVQTLDLLAGQTDVDTGDVLSVVNITVTDDLGASVAFTDNGDGTISIDPSLYDALDDGESRTLTISYGVSDGTTTVVNTATLVVNGATDNTIPVAASDDLSTLLQTGEFLANTETNGAQNQPAIVSLANGGFVVTWQSADGVDDTSGTSIKAQMYDANGNAVGEEFLVNTKTRDYQITPSITALADGGFVITWSSNDGAHDISNSAGDWFQYGIKAQIYDANGDPVGSEFLVNTRTYDVQYTPTIAALSDGGFVITWRSSDAVDDQSHRSVKAQIYDANGNTVGSEFLVNSNTYLDQGKPSITALSDGGFVITWYSSDGVDDTSGTGIKAQIYDANGDTVGSEFLVNSETSGDQSTSKVTALSDGGFVITWHSSDGVDDKSGTSIKAQIYDANGDAIGSEFLVNSETDGDQSFPSITALSNGGFIITWQSRDGVDDTSGYGIKAQIYDASGNAVGDEFLVNIETSGDQTNPTVTALSDGGFAITWTSADGVDDTSSTGIKVRLFDADGSEASANSSENVVHTIWTSTLLANDTDADGDSLTVTAVSATSANGATVTLNSDGTISYDPTLAATIQALGEGETLTDTFTYTISDGNGGTSSATVTLTVAGVNDAPVVVAIDAGAVSEDDAVKVIDLLAGQSDVDVNDTLAVVNIVVTDDLGASVAFIDNGDGRISIDPSLYDSLDDGESRKLTISYGVSDGTTTVANTATLVVNGATDNTIPVASDDDLSALLHTGEFLVNTETSGTQNRPAIVTLANGGFVITWQSADGVDDTSATGIKAQIYDANGNAVGEEFLVNSKTSGDQNVPSITALADGGFVITWQSADGVDDTSATSIKAQIFDANGDAVGSEFLVNSVTYSYQYKPTITALSDGGFVITWESTDLIEDKSSGGIKAQIYDANGDAVGSEFLVNTRTSSEQSEPTITALSNGGFVITWQSYDTTDTSSTGIEAQIFDANGDAVGSEFLVNSVTKGSQIHPTITALSDGGFVITWNSVATMDIASSDIKAQMYDADGNTVGSEFLVNSETNENQSVPSITALSNGGFVITWQSKDGVDDTSGYGIKAQIYDASGNAVGDEFLVNSETTSNQYYPSVTALSNGGFVITWQSWQGVDDTSGYGIKAQIFDADGNPAGASFAEDSIHTIDTALLLSNDTDGDSDVLTVTAVSATSEHGATVTLNSDGTISYDPTGSVTLNALNNGETLTDTFTYTISDGHGGTSTATVTLSASGVTDAAVTPTTITGNALANVLETASGMNIMTGGNGADTFVLDTDALSNVSLADVITDYDLTGDGDKVDVSALLASVLGHEASGSEAAANLSVRSEGSDTVVSVDGHDVATLTDYTGAVRLIYDDSNHTTDVSAA